VNATEDLSPGAVWSGALENALPSAMNQISQTVKPLLDWKGDAALAHTVLTNPGAVGKAVADVYGPRYDLLHPDREGGILQTLKHDPFAPLSDAAAVGSILAGGELLAPKLAGTAGDVANIVGKAGKLSQNLDLAYAAARAGSKPLAASLKHAPEVVGGGLGATLGAAVPGAHLATSIAGERFGEALGKAAAQKVAPLASGVARAVGTTRRAIPLLTAASGVVPMSPEEQGQTPAGGGSPEAPAGAGAGAPGGGGPQLDPRYADDPVYAMLMGAVGGSAPAAGGSAAAAAPPAAPAPRGAIYNHIADVATRAGANPQEVAYLQRTAQIESGGDPNAKSPTGRYHGLFQYPGQMNVDDQIVRALQDARAHGARLGALGVDATPANLYIAHQQGAGGGPAILQAARENPDMSAVDALLPAYHGNRRLALSAIVGNVGRGVANAASMTAGEFVRYWQNRFGGGDRVPFAAGGEVVDMTEKLLQRANMAQKAAQAATKPLLALSDDTVAQALRTAQRGI